MSDEKFRGEVIWFSNSKGIGFLTHFDDNNERVEDAFVHYSDIIMSPSLDGRPAYKTLKKGEQVIYEMGLNNRGEPKAINVEVIKL